MTSAAKHTAGPCTVDFHHTKDYAGRTHAFVRAGSIVPLAAVVLGVEGCSQEEGRANAHLIAEAFTVAHETGLTPRQLAGRCADLLETLKQIRLWLAEEDCEEPLELADHALRAAGVTDVACPSCYGCGEWDEGPLLARSSAQINPEYRQVKCSDCNGTGRVSIADPEGGAA